MKKIGKNEFFAIIGFLDFFVLFRLFLSWLNESNFKCVLRGDGGATYAENIVI